MQTKEVSINKRQYKVKRRGFNSQCELTKKNVKELGLNDVIILSHTELFDTNTQQWREMTYTDLEEMDDNDGLELANEVTLINKREVVSDKDFRSTPKAKSTSSKST